MICIPKDRNGVFELNSTKTKWNKKVTDLVHGIHDSYTICSPDYSNVSLEGPKDEGKRPNWVYGRVKSVNGRKLENTHTHMHTHTPTYTYTQQFRKGIK